MKRFPSLKKNAEYQAVYHSGRSYATGRIVMMVAESAEDGNRLGICISKKVGNSVVRHTFCRKIREIFRFYNHRTKTGFHIVIVARNQAGKASYHELMQDYERLLRRHNILTDAVS